MRVSSSQPFRRRTLKKLINWVLSGAMALGGLIFFFAAAQELADSVSAVSMFGKLPVSLLLSLITCVAVSVSCLYGVRGCLRVNRRQRRIEALGRSPLAASGVFTFSQIARIWNMRTVDEAKAELSIMQRKGLLGGAQVDYTKEQLTLPGHAEPPPPQPPQPTLNEAEKEAAPVFARLKQVSARLLTAQDAALLQRFSDDIEAILADTRKDSRDIPGAVQFLHRFLPMGEKLITRLPDLPADRTQLRQQIIGALDNLHTAFGNKLRHLHENDRMEAEAEAAVLEQLLRNSGLAGDEEDRLFPLS